MMGEIIETNTDITPVNNVFQVSEDMLDEVRREIQTHECISFPVGKLSSLGAGVSSLIPAFRTATSTVDVNMQGLFRVANASSGDVLKMASDGTYWGAMKTAQKTSKMAKFAQAGPISEKISTVAPINPATIMMAGEMREQEWFSVFLPCSRYLLRVIIPNNPVNCFVDRSLMVWSAIPAAENEPFHTFHFG